MSEEELLELAAYAEAYSNHPISLSIKKAYQKEIEHNRIQNIEEIAGHGICAIVDNKKILAGNAKLMEREQIAYQPCTSAGTIIYLAIDGKFARSILIEDEVKADAPAAIRSLKASGIRETVMLTGDSDAVGQKVSKKLSLDKVYTQLLQGDKVERVKELLQALKEKQGNAN